MHQDPLLVYNVVQSGCPTSLHLPHVEALCNGRPGIQSSDRFRSIRHDKSTPNLRTRKFHQIREHKAAAASGTLEQQQCVSSSSHQLTRPAPSAAAASVTQTRQQTAHRLSQAGSSITHAVAAPLTMFSRFPYNTRPSGCPHCDSSSSHAVRTAVSHQFCGQAASVPMSAASAPQWWPVLASIPDTSQAAAAAVTHCSRP